MEKNIQLIVLQIIQVDQNLLNNKQKQIVFNFFKIHIVKPMNNNGKQQYKMDK